jgi:hypothetical protein
MCSIEIDPERENCEFYASLNGEQMVRYKYHHPSGKTFNCVTTVSSVTNPLGKARDKCLNWVKRGGAIV